MKLQNQTATTVFSGAGAKTKAAKLKDIDFSKIMTTINGFKNIKIDPTLPSEGSTAQVSQLNFKTGSSTYFNYRKRW